MRKLTVPLPLLALAAAVVTVTGCKKGKMEPAPEIKLNPEGSAIGI